MMSLTDRFIAVFATIFIAGLIVNLISPFFKSAELRTPKPVAAEQAQVAEDPTTKSYTIGQLVQNERPTELLLSLQPDMFTGHTYRYDVIVDNVYYFIWVNKDGYVTYYGPAPKQD